jgi:alanyl-tRNA synthetase
MDPMASSSTHVTFPAGATTGTGIVLAIHDLPAGIGVVVDVTPFHPLDHSWPDQPADTGVLVADGVEHAVVDCLTGGVGPDGAFAIGADIPVRRGDETWQWQVVHVLGGGAATPAPAPGTSVELRVDPERRAALCAAHTGCHLVALALNEALADRWRKEVRTDGLGHPDFDSIAMDTSVMDEHASTDRYRLGKSLRKKGFDPEGLAEALPEITARVNARLADWLDTDAAIRVDAPGPEITARRQWVCELPKGSVAIACGGTHLHRLGELTALTAALALSADGSELVLVTTPKRG